MDINEVSEELDKLDAALLDLERSISENNTNKDLIHIIFRHAHNLKGMLSFLGKEYSSNLIHEIESNFENIRNGNIEITIESIEKYLAAVDIVKSNLQDEENITISEAMLEELKNTDNNSKNSQEIETVTLSISYEENQILKNCIKNKFKTYVIEKIINSNIEKNDFENLFIFQDIQEIGILITFEPKFESINIENEHTILKIYFASENNYNTISMSIFDPFKEIYINTIIEDESFIEELSSPNNQNILINDLIDENTVIKYLEEIYSINSQIDTKFLELENKIDDIELIKDIKRLVHTLKGNANFLGLFDIERICNEIEDIIFKLSDDKNTINESTFQKLFDFIDIIKIDIEQKINQKNNNKKSNDIRQNVRKKEKEYFIKRTDIRVDTEKLDKLFDLVGELITIESILLNSEELKHINSPNFRKNSVMLKKIIREIQDVSMMIRMLPIEGLFSKMKRVVRDLSHKTGKKIDFEIFGQSTEMDKNIIEEISNPLIHILRNAVDHGIEDEKERISKGKNTTGKIKIGAGYEGNEIIILIQDDGKGLDKDKIIQKAISLGLIEQESEKEIDDKKIFNFIFEPGFSTAQKITDISGRGVGLDVVKKNIEKLRGKISVESKKDQGSIFKLKIPLTIAIIDSMLIRIGKNRYAIPLSNIRQSFRPNLESITKTMDGNEFVKVRENIYPVIRLHKFFNIESQFDNLNEGILIIIEGLNQKACIFVDEVLGQQQVVVKALDEYIGNIEGLIGAMIAGNGEIGFIIDIEKVLEIY